MSDPRGVITRVTDAWSEDAFRGGNSAEGSLPTEVQLVGLLRDVLTRLDEGGIELEYETSTNDRTDLLLFGQNVDYYEVLHVAPQTMERLDSAIGQLKAYAKTLRQDLEREVDLHLVTSGIFGEAQLAVLAEHGIHAIDKRWLILQADRVGLGSAALQLLGTLPGGKRAHDLIRTLQATKSGNSYWPAYQRLCFDILEYLFTPPLSRAVWERPNAAGTNRRDIVMPNYATEGFWLYARQTYQAELVVVDAKNHGNPIGKNEVVLTANYLSVHSTGLLGLIVTRKGESATGTSVRREQWIAHHKMLIVLNDADLIQMLTTKAAGGAPEELIRQKLEDFRLSM